MFEYDRGRPFLRRARGVMTAGGILLACFSPLLIAGPGEAQPAPSAATTSQKDVPDYTETRIAELHDKMHISEGQAGQWEAVARVMRANAKAIEALTAESRKNEQSMTAVEDLRAYQEIVAAQAKSAQKLADAFDVLYQTMTDDQRKLADAVFRQYRQNAMKAGK
ncbi:Spy/CpxP family protein refolding chaperone [Telmatospirillum siberiense]|nr:Spy/CpxP family protein refolding chaperone [Telmatospirillum siberiense]